MLYHLITEDCFLHLVLLHFLYHLLRLHLHIFQLNSLSFLSPSHLLTFSPSLLSLTNTPTTHSFNLRDLSRVYEGLCNADLDVITTQNQFVRLWRNECDRVICDRLTTIEDRQLYLTQMRTVIQGMYVCICVYVLYTCVRVLIDVISDYFSINSSTF
jgi:AAA+ lid domain